MKQFAIAYGWVFLIMGLLDGVWLVVMGKQFYSQKLVHLMADKPSWVPAILFYVLFPIGIASLVVMPALTYQWSLPKVWVSGAVLGFVSYATYNLTNQAVLRNWPLSVTVVDLIWGTLVTGTVALIVRLLMNVKV